MHSEALTLLVSNLENPFNLGKAENVRLALGVNTDAETSEARQDTSAEGFDTIT